MILWKFPAGLNPRTGGKRQTLLSAQPPRDPGNDIVTRDSCPFIYFLVEVRSEFLVKTLHDGELIGEGIRGWNGVLSNSFFSVCWLWDGQGSSPWGIIIPSSSLAGGVCASSGIKWFIFLTRRWRNRVGSGWLHQTNEKRVAPELGSARQDWELIFHRSSEILLNFASLWIMYQSAHYQNSNILKYLLNKHESSVLDYLGSIFTRRGEIQAFSFSGNKGQTGSINSCFWEMGFDIHESQHSWGKNIIKERESLKAQGSPLHNSRNHQGAHLGYTEVQVLSIPRRVFSGWRISGS